MTQRPIVAYLSLKGTSAPEIHDNIVATLGPDVVSYSSVTRYLREAQFPPSKPERHPADVQRDLDDSDQVILAALENSSVLVWQLSRLTHLPLTTVYRRLTQSLGFVAPHLRWVPHALPDGQKGERVNLSQRLLQMLEVQLYRAWHDMTSSPSTSLGFTRVRIMNSSGCHEMKKFQKENDTQFNRNIHVHDRLESVGVSFNQGSRKRSQVQGRLLYRADIRAIAPMALN
jgi:hypothetical protein